MVLECVCGTVTKIVVAEYVEISVLKTGGGVETCGSSSMSIVDGNRRRCV
jgi:hypothetical protein